MAVKAKILGKKKLSNQLKNMSNDLRSDLAKQMAISLAQMNQDVKKGINTGARSGAFYKRGKKSRQRSAPGELPKTDTGDLVSKFSTKVKVKQTEVIGVLGNNSDHAMELEFGSSQQGGRPFMRPLWNKWSPILTVKFKAVIKRSLRKNSK